MHRDIHLDFNESFAPQQPQGVQETDLNSIRENLTQVHRGLQAMHEMGQVQFLNLPFLEDVLVLLDQRARLLRDRFDTMVVLGIGGSGLGAKAVYETLQGPMFQGLPLAGDKKLYVLDTLDPELIGRLLESLDLSKTVFNVVSKSGNTVETVAQFMLVYHWLKDRLGESAVRSQIIMTTDATKGVLRQLCNEEGFESFEILPGVGGRFSVLSPVGLLPAAFIGASIKEIASGAQRMIKRCSQEDLWTNPAAMLAAVTYLLSNKYGKNQLVAFNYSERLNSCVEWFRQLWAESLGKKMDLSGKEIRSGITPISASGPRDQHSQIQLYVEGPTDKMVMFWSQEKFEIDPKIPAIFPQLENLNYLGKKHLSEILLAEQEATEQALREAGVPSFRLMLFGADPYTLGQLFYLLELATVYVGGILNVNPYDQPGVELGKKYLYGKLGRKGFEEYGSVLARKLKDKRYIV